jgi:NitT/TauT family transport system substrate-binding protein
LAACGIKASDNSAGTAANASANTSAVTGTSAGASGNQATDTKQVAVNGKNGKIKVLYSAGLCGIPMHIAKQLKFFEAEGLVEGKDYEFLTSSTPGIEMLSTGQADVTFGLIAAMLAPLDNGLEAKTVIGIHTGCIQILANSKAGIKTLKDLKGKKIGVSQLASSAQIVTQRALASVGIGSTADNMQVEFVVYNKDDLPIALKKGAVDAAALGDPQATILVNEGAALPLFNSATDDLLKDEYCCALWFRNEVLEKYPEQSAKVTRAIQKASAWVEQNVDLAAQIQLDNKWLVGDLKIDQQVLKTYKYLPSVSGDEKALTRNILDMKKLGLIKKDTDEVQLAKNSFLRLDGVPDDVVGKVEAPIDPLTQIKTGTEATSTGAVSTGAVSTGAVSTGSASTNNSK